MTVLMGYVRSPPAPAAGVLACTAAGLAGAAVAATGLHRSPSD
ncbi:hypothetical protein [Micromonospora sp. DT47]